MTPTLIGIEQNEATVSFPASNPVLASWRLRRCDAGMLIQAAHPTLTAAIAAR